MAQHTAPPATKRPEGRSRSTVLAWVAGGIVVLLVAVAGFVLVGTDGDDAAAPDAPAGAAAAVADVSELPIVSTYTTVTGAPPDTAIDATTDGSVVHPRRETPVHDGPDGVAIARVEPTQFGDAWFPVIAEEGDWVQVLLPSKPAASTGWIRSADLERATSPYLIRVHVGSRTLELLRDGVSVGEWTVAVGAAQTPTPTGRTYLLGAFTSPSQDFSPVILPLGTHSPSLDSFGGGPGTVAIHTWPTDDTYGDAVSNGCIRVPQDALDQLIEVPLGTLVMIDQE